MLSDYFIQRLSENLPYVPTEEQADLIARLLFCGTITCPLFFY